MLKDRISDDESQIISAQTGRIVNYEDDKSLILYNGKIINQINNTQNIIEFSEFKFDLSKYGTKTTTYPKIQETNSKELYKCLSEIYSFEKNKNLYEDYNRLYPGCEVKNKKTVLEELFKRFYSPIYIILISLIASLVILNSKNNKNYSSINSLILLIGIIIVVISEVSISYSSTSLANSIIFISLPALIFISTYIFLIYSLKKK